MRYPACEKTEIIELVERSHLPAKRTLGNLGIGTVRIFVFEAILMKHEGASNGYREGRVGSASCRA